MKVGVLGHGSIGARHVKNLRAMKHEVVCYDPSLESAAVMNRDSLIARSEAIVIATPTERHFQDLTDCINAGKHVFIEKPIATTTGSIRRAIANAKKLGLVVMVGNNLRFHHSVIRTEGWLRANEIGQPLWAQFMVCQENARYTDSVVLNWGAHEIDLALYYLGPAGVVASVVKKDTLGREHVADITLQHLSGCQSTIHLDYVTAPEIRTSHIVGTKGRIVTDLVARNAMLYNGDDEWTVTGARDNYDANYVSELHAFFDRIDGRLTLGTDGEFGLATVDICEQARRMAGV